MTHIFDDAEQIRLENASNWEQMTNAEKAAAGARLEQALRIPLAYLRHLVKENESARSAESSLPIHSQAESTRGGNDARRPSAPDRAFSAATGSANSDFQESRSRSFAAGSSWYSGYPDDAAMPGPLLHTEDTYQNGTNCLTAGDEPASQNAARVEDTDTASSSEESIFGPTQPSTDSGYMSDAGRRQLQSITSMPSSSSALFFPNPLPSPRLDTPQDPTAATCETRGGGEGGRAPAGQKRPQVEENATSKRHKSSAANTATALIPSETLNADPDFEISGSQNGSDNSDNGETSGLDLLANVVSSIAENDQSLLATVPGEYGVSFSSGPEDDPGGSFNPSSASHDAGAQDSQSRTVPHATDEDVQSWTFPRVTDEDVQSWTFPQMTDEDVQSWVADFLLYPVLPCVETPNSHVDH